MNCPHFAFRFAMFLGAWAVCSSTQAQDPVLPGWTFERITAEPDLVTPTGCCFDDQGRLMVIECHTHFPPDDYEGPKVDRIYRFDDSDGDGVLDRKRLFYEGGQASMNIVSLGERSFAVATRSEIVRYRDTDDDGMADDRAVLLTHKTDAEYPHNGLSGLVLGSDGWLYVGQGENFGEAYELVGTDGSQQAGGGEGGNIFRCRPDGSNVERVATGFWNPFGLCLDHANRLWAAGNDPDAMPPNRLMQIAPGGDYGFQFRFGRAGIHPLQSWNGEFPGTLPMAAGTGEAVCSIVIRGKYIYAASWGDNRIERYELMPNGASWTSKTEVVVQGDAMFRPVGLAVASDGSIYVTDWVDRSYPVHRKGRLWRLSPPVAETGLSESIPKLTEPESLARSLQLPVGLTVDQRLSALDSDDPFIRQGSITGLVASPGLDDIDLTQLKSARQIVGVLTALRWRELNDPTAIDPNQRDQWLEWCLTSDEDDVTLATLRWATERQCQDLLPAIRSLLKRDNLTPRIFAAAIASIAYIETGSASGKQRDPAIEQLLREFAADSNRTASLRAIAIQKLPSETESPTNLELSQWLQETRDPGFAREVIALIKMRSADGTERLLREIAADSNLNPEARADALAGLSLDNPSSVTFIKRLLTVSDAESLIPEAQRLIQSAEPEKPDSRPAATDLKGWNQLVGEHGNIEAGRRVFFRSQCVSCHRHNGRGSRTGPDLSTLAGSMTRERVLESILQPSKEVGPLYVPWKVLTVDGKVITGLKLDASGVGNSIRFQLDDGSIVEVALEDIEEQRAFEKSIMPDGLEKTMTVEELRDLLAFLTSESAN